MRNAVKRLLRLQPEIEEAQDTLDEIDRRAEHDAEMRKRVSASLEMVRREMQQLQRMVR